MAEFDINPGLKRRTFAALLVVVAIWEAVVGPLSAKFTAGAIVLFAIDLAFIPSPSLHLTLRDIYGMARRGWRMPWAAKFLSAGGFILMATGLYLLWQGR